MKNKIRVVIWGLGVMGSGIAKMVLSKKGFTIVGAIDIDPNKLGKKLYEVLGLEATEDNSCIITDNAEEIIKKGYGDVCIIADIQNNTGYDVLAQMAMSFFSNGHIPITALSFLYEDGELEPIFILGKNKKRD